MRNVVLAACIAAASVLGLGLALDLFATEGSCTIECQGSRPQGAWSASTEPLDNISRRACEHRARAAQTEGVTCTGQFTPH